MAELQSWRNLQEIFFACRLRSIPRKVFRNFTPYKKMVLVINPSEGPQMGIYIGPGILVVGLMLLVFGFMYFKKPPPNRQDHIDKMNKMKSH